MSNANLLTALSSGLNTGAGAGGASPGAGGFPYASLAMMLAPMLLGPLMNGFDPAARRARQIQERLSPAYLAKLREMFMRQVFNGAGYASTARGVNAGAQAAEGAMRTNLARTGMSGSGIGAVAPALAHMNFSTNMGKINTGYENMATQLAGQAQQTEVAGLSGAPVQPNYMANLFAAGLNAGGPLLGSYYRKKYELPELRAA